MKGRRIYPDDKGQMRFQPGDYGKNVDGVWYGRPPRGHTGTFEDHKVTEHEDGSISVEPSILITCGAEKWHGYLTCGVWNECE